MSGVMRSRLAAMVLVPATLAVPAAAQQPVPAGGWRFAVEPYVWIPATDGTLKYAIPPGDEGGGDVGLSAEDISFAFMLNGEARHGDWAVLADVVYVDLSSASSTVDSVRFASGGGTEQVAAAPDLGTETSVTGLQWSASAAYALASGDRASLDVVLGVRYLTIEATTEWRLAAEVAGPDPGQIFELSGRVEARAELWDGVVGLRSQIALGRGWSVPLYADAGAGSAALTWQAVAGISYRFGWGDLRLVYRHLAYDMSDDKLLQGMTFSGPALGARFRF